MYVEEAAVEAPDYTEAGERRWQQSSLHIERVRRTDDGLYECNVHTCFAATKLGIP